MSKFENNCMLRYHRFENLVKFAISSVRLTGPLGKINFCIEGRQDYVKTTITNDKTPGTEVRYSKGDVQKNHVDRLNEGQESRYIS